MWITVSGILLAGVVFVNVAVLRMNLALDSANSDRAKLHAEIATLQSQSRASYGRDGSRLRRSSSSGSPTRPVSVRIRPSDEVKPSEKQANRRIRLLLAIFVLVFTGTLARAVWLQGVHAASLGRMAERQHRETITTPAGRGAIFDRTGVQLAIGEQTTTVYADPRQVIQPRPSPLRRTSSSASTRTSSTPSCSAQVELPLRQAVRRPEGCGRVPQEGLHRGQLVSGGEADVSAADGRRPTGRLRGHRQQGARRPGGRVRQALSGSPGKRTIVRTRLGAQST